MRIVAFCELDTQKAWRETCKALYLAASVLPLGQVYLAAREKTLRAVLAICRDDAYRIKATGLVIDVVVFPLPKAVSDPDALQAMYLAKHELRKPGYDKLKPSLAIHEYRDLFRAQNRCMLENQGDRFRRVLKIALTRLENIQTIRITNHLSDWYYCDGPLSWDVKFAPFPNLSTAPTLGFFTLNLMEELWRARHTRSPKLKSFVAEIVDDLNGIQDITGLPYDAMYWGVKSMTKQDDSALKEVLFGFETLSMDISLKRFYWGFGEFFKIGKKEATLAQKRIEWAGVGKILAGAENLSNLDIRFRDYPLERRYFQDCMASSRWVNLTSLHLCNFMASAQTLWHVLETHVKLESLVLERALVEGELQPTGAVQGQPTGAVQGQPTGAVPWWKADFPVWTDIAERVGALLTLNKVALFCLQEEPDDEDWRGEYRMSGWTCERSPECRFLELEGEMLAKRVNEWDAQNHQKHLLTCGESD